MSCALCTEDGGAVIHRAADWRVVRAEEAGFPAFYRVVWNAHVAEWSDLSGDARVRCMEVVVAVEQGLRRHLSPAKINLASLGNLVAHLHWHVVARFEDDSHFPAPLWAPATRARSQPGEARVLAARPAIEADLARRLAELDRTGNSPWQD